MHESGEQQLPVHSVRRSTLTLNRLADDDRCIEHDRTKLGMICFCSILKKRDDTSSGRRSQNRSAGLAGHLLVANRFEIRLCRVHKAAV